MPRSPSPLAATGVDVQALVRRREAGEQGAGLVLVACDEPRGSLEPTAVSALVPPLPSGVARWEAFWSDDDGYVLRGVREVPGARDAWFALGVAAGETAPDTVEAHRTSVGARRPRLQTVLVGWRPNGSGAARWSVASRRA